MYHGSSKNPLLLVVCLILCYLASPIVMSHADGHNGSKHGLAKVDKHGIAKHDHGRNSDHGNEITGEMAAWMLGFANFPVALSLILKTSANLLPPALNFKDPITRFNRRQKKYLMKLHYWLNPIALGVALTHFLQVHGHAGVGTVGHVGRHSPRADDEIQIVTSVNAAKDP